MRKYDRQGKEIHDVVEWARLCENKEYKVVARHEDERVLISTVWLGLDHSWGVNAAPLIFETMVFVRESQDIDNKYDELQWRWHTEKEAKEGHDIIVNCYRENKEPEKAIEEWRSTKQIDFGHGG